MAEDDTATSAEARGGVTPPSTLQEVEKSRGSDAETAPEASLTPAKTGAVGTPEATGKPYPAGQTSLFFGIRLAGLTLSLVGLDTSVVGGSPMGDPAAATLYQEVTKATPEVMTTARPGDGRVPAPSGGPVGAETSNRTDTPDLLNSSWMTGEELKAYAEFSTCSGASDEIAALAEIKD